jgi:DNA-binding Lrp family transcriptional regulator
MDAYMFIQTEPGLAAHVMGTLVESGSASRAAIVTGEFDVFARIDDVSWDQLEGRVLHGAQRIPGIVRTTTAVVMPMDTFMPGFHVPTLPLRGVPARSEPRIALVFANYNSDLSPDTVRSIAGAKGVLAYAHVSGEYDAIIQVSGRDIKQISGRVGDIRMTAGVESTNTMLVVASTPHVKTKGSRKR